MNRRHFHRFAALNTFLTAKAQTYTQNPPNPWSFQMQPNQLLIKYNQQLIMTYVFTDPAVKRPYFMDLHTASGTRISRHNPPHPDIEATDHTTMHPGLWLAFGRLNGDDYWRNKAHVQHMFLQSPTVKSNQLYFSVRNTYHPIDNTKLPTNEIAEFRLSSHQGILILDWNSTITTKSKFLQLGHQEEMGLGVRLATPLCVKTGHGQLHNSQGGTNEKETWGKESKWWAASMPSTGANPKNLRSGIQIIAQNSNSLKFWGHTRDYGLIVANPTPRPDQNLDSIELPADKPLKMQFRILLFENIKPEFEKWGKTKLPTDAGFKSSPHS